MKGLYTASHSKMLHLRSHSNDGSHFILDLPTKRLCMRGSIDVNQTPIRLAAEYECIVYNTVHIQAIPGEVHGVVIGFLGHLWKKYIALGAKVESNCLGLLR